MLSLYGNIYQNELQVDHWIKKASVIYPPPAPSADSCTSEANSKKKKKHLKTAWQIACNSTSRRVSCVHEDKELTGMKVSSTSITDVSDILYWFLWEEGSLMGEELSWTDNTARDPLLSFLGRWLNLDRLDENLNDSCRGIKDVISIFTNPDSSLMM